MSQNKLAYGGRLERLFANLLDTLILLLPNGMIISLMSQVDGAGTPVLNPASLLVLFLCNTAYYTAFTSSGWQGTPGKRMLGIYVIRTDGHRLTQRDALERYLAFILPSLPLYASFISPNLSQFLVVVLSLIWFAPILYTPNRTGIHDQICGTRVVCGRL